MKRWQGVKSNGIAASNIPPLWDSNRQLPEVSIAMYVIFLNRPAATLTYLFEPQPRLSLQPRHRTSK